MPIISYSKPQSRIYELLQATAAPSLPRTASLVIGTQYLINYNDGRALPTEVFTASGATINYKTKVNSVDTLLDLTRNSVDLPSVKLFGADLEAVVATTLNFGRYTVSPSGLRLTSGQNNVSGGTLNSALTGRPIQVGDRVKISVDNQTSGSFVSADAIFYRTVTGLIPKISTPTVNGASTGSVLVNADAGNAQVNAAIAVDVNSTPTGWSLIAGNVTINGNADQFFRVGGRYNSKLGEKINLVVTTGGSNTTAVFQVSYASRGTSESVVATAGSGGTEFVLTLTQYNNSTIKLVITGSTAFLGQTASYTIYPINAANAATMIRVDDSANYTGTTDTVYIIEVLVGVNNAGSGDLTGCRIRVSDTSGQEVPQTYTATAASFPANIPLGSRGLTFTVNSAASGFPDPVTGDRFLITVANTGTVTGQYDGVLLDGPAYDIAAFSTSTGKFSVDVIVPYTGELTTSNVATGAAYTASAPSLTYAASLGVTTTKTSSAFCPFTSGRGTVKISYRAATKIADDEPLFTISNADDIPGELGEMVLSNDLSYGAYWMNSGAQGLTFYVKRVSDDTPASWTAALKAVSSTDLFTNMAILSDNPAVHDLVSAHVTSMSSPENQNFRGAYAGLDSPGAYTYLGAYPDGSFRKGTLISDMVTLSVGDRNLTNFLTQTINPGDTISFQSLSAPLVIVAVVSAYEIRVVNPTSASISIDSAFTIGKPDTSDSQIDYLVQRGNARSNRRFVYVWCDKGSYLGTTMPSKFVACEIAGLRSALLPQQGLTMTDLASITSAPAMYTRYDQTQLNRAASNGIMIVTQAAATGPVYIRHQLTTQTGNGALQYEDNVRLVVDTLAFRIKDMQAGLIGKYNVTPQTKTKIEVASKAIYQEATQTPLANSDIGPMITGFFDAAGNEGQVTVAIDSTLADSMSNYAKVRIPLPLNHLNSYIDAVVSNLPV